MPCRVAADSTTSLGVRSTPVLPSHVALAAPVEREVRGTALRAPEGTESFLLNEVNFHGSRRLRKGCIGILRWRARDNTGFSFVEDPWLDAYTRANYRTLKRDE